MGSLYDGLNDKVNKEPRLTKPGVSKFDLTLLLFNARESIAELWRAADAASCGAGGGAADARLQAAVDALRPIFGDRAGA